MRPLRSSPHLPRSRSPGRAGRRLGQRRAGLAPLQRLPNGPSTTSARRRRPGLAGVRFGSLPLYATGSVQISADDFDRPGLGVYDGSFSAIDQAVGLRLMRPQGWIRPYVGAALAGTSVSVSYEDDYHHGYEDDDQSFGYVVGTGAQFHLRHHLVAAVDARWLLGSDEMAFDNGIREQANSFPAC